MGEGRKRIGFDLRFTHVVEAASSLVLVGDEDSAVLEGDGVVDLVPMLDGSRTEIEIADRLAHRHPREVVHFALIRLRAAGLIREIDDGPAGAPEPAACGPPGADALAEELEGCWRERRMSPVVRHRVSDSLRVALTDDYLVPELSTIADEARGPTLLVRLGVRDLWLGPGIGYDGGACPQCLQDRLRLNLVARAFMRSVERPVAARVWALPTSIPRRAFEVLSERLTTRPAPDGAALRVLDLLQPGEEVVHPVPRRPDCPRCGDPGVTSPGARMRIRGDVRTFRQGGGYRVCGPRETWERFSPLISPLTGVVRRVRRVDHPNNDLIHVYTASHGATYTAVSVKAVKDDARDHSGGKGATDLDARVSALAEALERCSAVRRGNEPTRRARLFELGAEGIHPNAVMGFSERQYAERVSWNAATAGGFQWVPEPYRDQEIEWSPALSLTTGAVSWVPSALVFLGYQGEGCRFCKGDSNGLAGGNCPEEAVLQGLLELIERDAIALWWYNRVRRPAWDLGGFREAYVDRVVDYYRESGRSLWALDLTTDLRIPCVAVVSAAKRPREDIIFGFGCHLDPRIALRRALTEANQMLPTVARTLAERRRQLLPEFRDAIEWWETARLADHPHLIPSGHVHTADVGGLSGDGPHRLGEAISHCVGRLAAAGLEVFAHEHTRADIGFAVVKLLAPGLRHFWRRLAPGRLYDVPLALGWVDSRRTEGEMNPISMFV